MKSSATLCTFLIGSLMLLAAFSSALVFAGPITALGMCAGGRGSSWYSSNWSGYVVNSTVGSVTAAYGSWVVPAVTGSRFTTAYSSFWVGIDGWIGSSTVEQIGTDSDINRGTPTYYAWYEFYPYEAMAPISSLTISPGDGISASVTYNTATSNFTLYIEDLKTTQSFSWTQSASSLGYPTARISAEWIAEAPSSSRGVLPLAKFGTVKFGYDSTGVVGTCYATVGGTTGSIGSFESVSPNMVQEIAMANIVYNSRTHSYIVVGLKAVPSSLTTDGTSFSVTWYSSQNAPFL